MRGDGDGWSLGPDGHRRWGRHGAAGLLLRCPQEPGEPAVFPGEPAVLLQHRAVWSHHGGTWGLPGGARDSHETPVQAALREAAEEAGVRERNVRVRATRTTATTEQGWSYTTVLADVAGVVALQPNRESAELRWVAEGDVDALPLHPGFAHSWPVLRARPLRLLVDTANLLGARPDGWWRDRAGATERMLLHVRAAIPRTVALPDGSYGWVSAVEAVLEGAARHVQVGGVLMHRAHGSGDDELVRVAHGAHLVVTADRGLRARLPADVAVLGPSMVRRWLAENVERAT